MSPEGTNGDAGGPSVDDMVQSIRAGIFQKITMAAVLAMSTLLDEGKVPQAEFDRFMTGLRDPCGSTVFFSPNDDTLLAMPVQGEPREVPRARRRRGKT